MIIILLGKVSDVIGHKLTTTHHEAQEIIKKGTKYQLAFC